jgi:hypothetical protein
MPRPPIWDCTIISLFRIVRGAHRRRGAAKPARHGVVATSPPVDVYGTDNQGRLADINLILGLDTNAAGLQVSYLRRRPILRGVPQTARKFCRGDRIRTYDPQRAKQVRGNRSRVRRAFQTIRERESMPDGMRTVTGVAVGVSTPTRPGTNC